MRSKLTVLLLAIAFLMSGVELASAGPKSVGANVATNNDNTKTGGNKHKKKHKKKQQKKVIRVKKHKKHHRHKKNHKKQTTVTNTAPSKTGKL
jgi:hypothetical protein